MSIIKRFSIVISSLTKHSYNDLESEQMTIGICTSPRTSMIRPKVVLRAIPLSNSVIILYNSLANTDLVTRLHLVDDQWMMLSWRSNESSIQISSVIKTIRKPNCDIISVLLANDPFVKMNSFIQSRSRG